MAKSAADILANKKKLLIERTSLALSITNEEAEGLLRIPRQQSIRINTLKTSIEAMRQWFADHSVDAQPVAWCEEGYSVNDLTLIKSSTLATDGELYIQNAASWLPVLALDPQPGERILDVCAAPGGKTSHIAQRAQNKASITANDNSRPRLMKLQSNLRRMGVENTEYTLHDATQLLRKIGDAQFDKILLDAPCSGEGMMTLDDSKSFSSWSVAHIKRLQQLQKRLIAQAWQLLEPGGTLIYSTCTMAPEENEAIIDYLLRHNDDAEIIPMEIEGQIDNRVPPVKTWNGKVYDERIEQALRLKPSQQLEAFFVCALHKTGDTRG